MKKLITQLLTMSTFTQIPLSLINIKSRNKFKLIYAYLLIRNQIKNSSLKASISESELAKLLNVSERSVKQYIDDLKPYFKSISKAKGSNEYPYNVYEFSSLKTDYSIVLSDIVLDNNLSADEKGLLIRIKLLCFKGTNHLIFKNKSELANILGISKNQISDRINSLLNKGYISIIDNSLILNDKYFPLSLKRDNSLEAVLNYIYESIYKFCISLNTVPPLKERKSLMYIIAKYPNIDNKIPKLLKERVDTLPKDVSLDYFVKVLNNKQVKRVCYS